MKISNAEAGTGGEILPSGRIVVGANYGASHAATQMWRKWDAKAVEEDLRVLADAGILLMLEGTEQP